MTRFEESEWAQEEFSRGYRDDSDIFLPLRSRFIGTALSLYGQWMPRDAETAVLDLGCGDGLFVEALLRSFSPARVRLLDGSSDMLDAARERLGQRENIFYSQASFQALLADDPLKETYDFIYSSLAIHHLSLAEKKDLYAYIQGHLTSGGCFVHYDVVAPPSERLETCYMSLWRQWIGSHPAKERRQGLMGIPDEYKANPDNLPDTLDSQLNAMRALGFEHVDCYFKYGMFALFGGCK